MVEGTYDFRSGLPFVKLVAISNSLSVQMHLAVRLTFFKAGMGSPQLRDADLWSMRRIA